MPSIVEQLEALPLLDSFNRANENPMAHGSWKATPLGNGIGQVIHERWAAREGFLEGQEGAYWNAEALKAPAVKGGPLWRFNAAERWGALLAALEPVAKNGYRLKLVQLAKLSEVEWRIERIDKGAVTLLKSGVLTGVKEGNFVNTERIFALTVKSGEVKAWQKVGAGAWELLGTAVDGTYTTGYVGMEAAGSEDMEWDALYGGTLAVTLVNTNLSAPVASGTPFSGEALSVTPGIWETEPEAVEYQWQVAESENGPWANIGGATNPEYEPGTEQLGKFLRCIVTVTNGADKTSVASGVVGPIESFTQSELGEPHGFPDWQPWLARDTAPLYSSPALTINGEKVLGPFYVADAEAINLFLQQTAGATPYQATVYWHSQPVKAQPYASETFNLTPTAGELNQQLPCQGFYVTIVLAPLGAAGEVTYRVKARRVQALAPEPRLGNPVFFASAPTAVKAGGNAQLFMTRTVRGPCRLAYTASGEGATRTLALAKINSKGEWETFFTIRLADLSAFTVNQIVLPPSPIRLTITNGSAAEITVTVLMGAG